MDADTMKKSPDEECGVGEDEFPCLGKCFCKNFDIFKLSYEKSCPYCVIWPSLPYWPSLKMTTIFECSKFGYSKRIIE